jgi:glyoxylase-like metal-dependent hydrolase (beta-lactamase superfamily II)
LHSNGLFFCVKIMTNAKIEKVSENLFLVCLVPPMAGFDNFIGVWVKTGKPGFIIDVGPSATVRPLKEALDELQVRDLDYIFITHIHIDHAGGIGDFSRFFPNTPVICHKTAMAHLADPTRLWEGSLKTLGDMARAYGPIAAVPQTLLTDAQNFVHDGIIPVMTPGHAPHHVSFWTPECLFAGETCGVHLVLPGGRQYLRPATPPKFFLETSIKSIDLLMGYAPEKICFGHHGMEDNALNWLSAHKNQLILWKNIIRDEMKHRESESFFSNCIERFKKEDPFLKHFDLLNDGERQRETYFITNSIKGYAGYLETNG